MERHVGMKEHGIEEKYEGEGQRSLMGLGSKCSFLLWNDVLNLSYK